MSKYKLVFRPDSGDHIAFVVEDKEVSVAVCDEHGEIEQFVIAAVCVPTDVYVVGSQPFEVRVIKD